MRFLRPLSARHLLVVALLSAACSPGNVSPLKLPDAGTDFFGSGGSGTSASGHGDPSDSLAGSGGGGMFSPCAADPASEDPLVNALNRAIVDGRFCLRRQLMVREDLRCDAYRLAFSLSDPNSPWVAPALGWHVLPDGSGRAWWASREAVSVDEARTAMLSEDSQEICDNAGRMQMPYKWVAVAHAFDAWVVELKADMP